VRPTISRARRRGGASGGGGGSSAFFTDTFASGDLTKTENNFLWSSPQNVSVINTATVGLPSNPSASNRAIRFDYNTSNNAELRFIIDNVGSGYATLFIRYYVFLPNGDEGGTVGPQWARTGGLNNKVLRLYDTTGLDTSTLRIGASTYGGVGTGAIAEEVFLETGGPSFYNSPGDFGAAKYIWSNPANRGTWQKIEWEVSMNTVTASSWNTGGDGILRMYVNDVMRTETTTGSLGPAGSRLRGGYLMGFPNSPYNNAGTYMYLTDFAVSSTGRI
jgi:hypothetical protein